MSLTFRPQMIVAMSALVAACSASQDVGSPLQPPGSGQFKSLRVEPGTSTLSVGGAQQFYARVNYADGTSALVSATWTASDGSISATGLYSATVVGTTIKIVASLPAYSAADTAVVTVVAPPPNSSTHAAPDLLPAVSGQAADYAAYTALSVPSMAAGMSYQDPVTGARVWKVTSPSVPYSNTSMEHFYSEGPAQISLPWGPNADQYTLYVFGSPGGSGWLVDFRRGVGFSNWRPGPQAVTNLQFSFSRNAATPQIGYFLAGGSLQRYDTRGNTIANTGFFPVNWGGQDWLNVGVGDVWFTAESTNFTDLFAFNAQSGQVLKQVVPNADGNRHSNVLESNGQFCAIFLTERTARLWNLQNNTTADVTAPGNAVWSHIAGPRGFWALSDPNTGLGTTPLWRVNVAGQGTQFTTTGGYTPDQHSSGKWYQADADLPGADLTKQWILRTTYNWSLAASGLGANEAMAFHRIDGSDARLLAHHYSVKPTAGADNYWSMPRAIVAQDGKLVMFDSNMNNSPRSDVFLVEVPIR